MEYTVTKQMTEDAIKALGRKATGVDELDAKIIKRKEHSEEG